MTGENNAPTNFIRQIIDADLKSGKHRRIHTRFPPEPNGYLHIGHAKSIVLNFGVAADYPGTCNLRFDDTNPAKEEEEFVEAIKSDVRWLGYEWEKLRFASDYFEQLYDYAVELIQNGKAFVCDLTAEQVKEIIMDSSIAPTFRVNVPGEDEEAMLNRLCVTGGVANTYAAVQLAIQTPGRKRRAPERDADLARP